MPTLHLLVCNKTTTGYIWNNTKRHSRGGNGNGPTSKTLKRAADKAMGEQTFRSRTAVLFWLRQVSGVRLSCMSRV